MEVLCNELDIPKKQIRETQNADRFIVTIHRLWLKTLIQNGKLLANFPKHADTNAAQAPKSWVTVYMTIYKKLNQNVIPLARVKGDHANDVPMTYSQIINYVSQTNHKNLWKKAFDKYSSSMSNHNKLNQNDTNDMSTSLNLKPYDVVFRDVVKRLFGCRIVNAKLDKIQNSQLDLDTNRNSLNADFDSDNNGNFYTVLAVIETEQYFFIIQNDFITNTLLDCITFSPAILNKSYNKQLFIIYQLLNTISVLHSNGLYLGDIELSDIYLTENLWLHIVPKLNCNLIQFDYFEEASSASHHHSMSHELNMLKDVRLEYKLKDYCQMWCYGQISNFDYLTILNNLSGRRRSAPDYYHIMPWITDFTSRNGTNWRDLTKSKYRLNKGDPQLDLTFQPHSNESNSHKEIPHHISDVLSEITYYVYMARRTPKPILCKYVRPIWVAAEYPVSIQRLQEWSPDECITEFFTDPNVFKSIHEDLPDLEVPSWSSCPEDFITKHREALESQYVSEKLHHWIDLTFGYKLTGKAAVKAKNVCLPLVDNHKNLCQRGVVQLFTNPHPPKQCSTIGKSPPRIYTHSESRRRLTRSTEDLSSQHTYLDYSSELMSGLCSQRYSSQSPIRLNMNMPESNLERSTTFYSIQQQQNQNYRTVQNKKILLPKNYNPVSQLNALENLETFMAKTFHQINEMKRTEKTVNYQNFMFSNREANSSMGDCSGEYMENSFTNRIFLQTYENSLLKDNAVFNNIKSVSHRNANIKRDLKNIITENRAKDLRILGVLIVEMFLLDKIRPLKTKNQTFTERYETCVNILKFELHSLPSCVKYPVQLLLQLNREDSDDDNLGLPQPPTANQLLQPLLSSSLFPFPTSYHRLYAAIRSLKHFDAITNILNLYTYFDCDGQQCAQYDEIEKTHTAFIRKIAECKVKACVELTKELLEPIGRDQFDAIKLILPHVIDLIRNEETSILAAWYLFDPMAIALGIQKTKKYLLHPILQLYDCDNDERTHFLNNNLDSSQKFITSSTFKSKKAVKLYHHSFLLRLIIRFGLKCFLENFIPPLIEAVGGYKDPEAENQLHFHEKRGKKQTIFIADSNTNTLISPESDRSSDKTLSPSIPILPNDAIEAEEMFTFENESMDKSFTDIKINPADEATDFGYNEDSGMKKYGNRNVEEDSLSMKSYESPQKSPANFGIPSKDPKSPTIPIPLSFRRGIEVNSIDCDIGSKKSFDSNDFLLQTPVDTSSMSNNLPEKKPLALKKIQPAETSVQSAISSHSSVRSNRISEMSSESIIWLSHRLGPVLTARYISRNLLKMLTLCYVGQENLLPGANIPGNINSFSIVDSRVVGDEIASNVLQCLTAISGLFGDQFILLQYFPHISELIALCKKRITPSLEGGLIAALQFVKNLIPYLNDSAIMDQLQDVILRLIIHPIIRLLGSSRFVMPSGFLARGVLARKLLDVIYVLSIRIGPEMAKDHLFIALQRFFLIFDKAFGIKENMSFENKRDSSPISSADESNYLGMRMAQSPTSAMETSGSNDLALIRTKALEEIKDVFTPHLAHTAFIPFLKFLGEYVMKQTVRNISLILNLCHEYEFSGPAAKVRLPNSSTPTRKTAGRDMVDNTCSNSFGSNVAIIGNRIEVQQTEGGDNEMGFSDQLTLFAYKLEDVNSSRNLRGNWLAYWEHEIGRSDKDNCFNLKQIKLQNYAGHTNAVRALLCLDNENSFMSASKDKTVKLWSLRSEGDGSKVSSCQFTYTNHRKSVHSLAFLESLRLAVSCDSSVHIWDPYVGDKVEQLETPKYAPVNIVKTYPASNLVLAGTSDATIKMIDARICSYVQEWKVSPTSNGSVRCIATSPSGKWIAVGLSSGQLTIVDGRTGLIICSWRATDSEILQLIAPNENQLISSSLDNNISVWSSLDGVLLYNLKTRPEPAHCLVCNGTELIVGTPANRIGVYNCLDYIATTNNNYTKLRSETFRGVLTSLALLPLNRALLVGGDGGNINLLC